MGFSDWLQGFVVDGGRHQCDPYDELPHIDAAQVASVNADGLGHVYNQNTWAKRISVLALHAHYTVETGHVTTVESVTTILRSMGFLVYTASYKPSGIRSDLSQKRLTVKLGCVGDALRIINDYKLGGLRI